jgi:septal ring factor EnvC (AmiA/AmiB activator)
MQGSRGSSPDAFTSLLNIVGDPDATKKRIKELQAATDENDKSLEALREREQALAAKDAELLVREKTLDGFEAKLEEFEKELNARREDMDERAAKLKELVA